MVQHMMGHLIMINVMGMVSITQEGISTLVHGKMISVMVMGYLHMILEMYMKGSIVMDKDMAKENMLKQMVQLFMMVDGIIMKLKSKVVIVL